jgi:hypothetical protein
MRESVQVAVRQQLREELLARAWAMHRIVSTPPVEGVRSASSEGRAVAAAVESWSVLLCGSNPTARLRTAALIERMLWPTFSPAAEWWTTPLGEAVLTARSASRPAAGTPLRRGTSAERAAVTAYSVECEQVAPLLR